MTLFYVLYYDLCLSPPPPTAKSHFWLEVKGGLFYMGGGSVT